MSFLGNLTGWHLLILVAIMLLLFGATKLPLLAKSVGQSARIFRGEMKAMKADDVPDAEEVESPPASGARSTLRGGERPPG